MRRKGDVDRLLRALQYSDVVHDDRGRSFDRGASIRAEALAAVVQLGDPRARDAAAVSLEDESPEVRLAAVRALGLLAPRHGAPWLVNAVVGWPAPPFGPARGEALALLIDRAAPEVAGDLIEAIDAERRADQLDEITRAAFDYLVVQPLGADETARILISRLAAGPVSVARVEQMLVWTGRPAVGRMIICLPTRAIRESLVRVLGRVQAIEAVPGLMDCMSDDRASVRRAAALALAGLRDPRAMGSMLNAMRDVDYGVREAAQFGLNRMGTVSVVAGMSALMGPARRL